LGVVALGDLVGVMMGVNHRVSAPAGALPLLALVAAILREHHLHCRVTTRFPPVVVDDCLSGTLPVPDKLLRYRFLPVTTAGQRKTRHECHKQQQSVRPSCLSHGASLL